MICFYQQSLLPLLLVCHRTGVAYSSLLYMLSLIGVEKNHITSCDIIIFLDAIALQWPKMGVMDSISSHRQVNCMSYMSFFQTAKSINWLRIPGLWVGQWLPSYWRIPFGKGQWCRKRFLCHGILCVDLCWLSPFKSWEYYHCCIKK